MSDISQLCCTMGDLGYFMAHSIKIFDQFLFFKFMSLTFTSVSVVGSLMVLDKHKIREMD